MKKQSHTVPRRRQSASAASRHSPLVDILIDAQAELQELVIASGLRVLEAMLEEDRAAVCGPRYAHQPARHAYRAGHAPSQVVLGGHKVAIRRPRVRRHGMEVPLPTAQAFTDADPLNRARRRPDAHRRGDPPICAESRTAGREHHDAGHQQECGQSTLCGADPGAAGRVARDTARRAGPGGAADRWGPGRRALYRGGAGHRHNGDQTPARPLGRSHGECDGLSGPVDQSCESRAAHRPEPPGDRRWGEGPRDGGDPDVRPGRRGAAVSSAQGPEHPGASPRGTTSVGEGNPYPRLHERHRQDGENDCCRTWLAAWTPTTRVRPRASEKASTRR